MLSTKAAAMVKSDVLKTEKVQRNIEEKDRGKQRVSYQDWYFHKCQNSNKSLKSVGLTNQYPKYQTISEQLEAETSPSLPTQSGNGNEQDSRSKQNDKAKRRETVQEAYSVKRGPQRTGNTKNRIQTHLNDSEDDIVDELNPYQQSDSNHLYGGKMRMFGHELTNINCDGQSSQSHLDDMSQATVGSKKSKAKAKSTSKKSLNSKQRRGRRLLVKDAHMIHAKAWEQSKKEMESPQKRRPQSGEASPNKDYQIRMDDDSEIQSFMNLSRVTKTSKKSVKPNPQKIFSEHLQTQILFKKTKEELQGVYENVQRVIEDSDNTINTFKKALNENQDKITKKVNDQLKKNFNIVIEEDETEEVKESRKKQDDNIRKKRKQTEYKFAFGQKIPVHYLWKVKQPTKEELERQKELDYQNRKASNSTSRPEFQLVYDLNGRTSYQRVEQSIIENPKAHHKSAGKKQNQSISNKRQVVSNQSKPKTTQIDESSVKNVDRINITPTKSERKADDIEEDQVETAYQNAEEKTTPEKELDEKEKARISAAAWFMNLFNSKRQEEEELQRQMEEKEEENDQVDEFDHQASQQIQEEEIQENEWNDEQNVKTTKHKSAGKSGRKPKDLIIKSKNKAFINSKSTHKPFVYNSAQKSTSIFSEQEGSAQNLIQCKFPESEIGQANPQDQLKKNRFQKSEKSKWGIRLKSQSSARGLQCNQIKQSAMITSKSTEKQKPTILRERVLLPSDSKQSIDKNRDTALIQPQILQMPKGTNLVTPQDLYVIQQQQVAGRSSTALERKGSKATNKNYDLVEAHQDQFESELSQKQSMTQFQELRRQNTDMANYHSKINLNFGLYNDQNQLNVSPQKEGSFDQDRNSVINQLITQENHNSTQKRFGRQLTEQKQHKKSKQHAAMTQVPFAGYDPRHDMKINDQSQQAQNPQQQQRLELDEKRRSINEQRRKSIEDQKMKNFDEKRKSIDKQNNSAIAGLPGLEKYIDEDELITKMFRWQPIKDKNRDSSKDVKK